MKTFTQLKDRILWYDGDITFTPDELCNYLLRGGTITESIHVDALNYEVENFNKLNTSLKLSVKNSLNVIDQTWNIPTEYKNINISKYITNKLYEELSNYNFNEDETNKRLDRVEKELLKYKEYNMFIILKTIIYIVDMFNKHNVVWGTGRGSSCASYILYLIGLHNVDSVKYDININEFFN